MSGTASAAPRRGINVLTYVFGALGGLLFGYDTGVIAGAILFIGQDFGTTAFQNGLIVSSLLIGAMIGAGSGGPLADRMGRRRLTLVVALIFGIGAIGAALAPGVGVLVLFRLVLGLAVGAASIVVPLFLSEMAPTEHRGAITSLNQAMIIVGVFLASVANLALAGAEAWRWMLGLALLPSLALLLGMYFMPETPRWLMKRGREREARRVLVQNRSPEQVENELAGIREIERLQARESGLGELLSGWVRPILVVGIGLAVGQQIIGINTIVYYTPTTLTEMGFSDLAAIQANVVIGVVNVVTIVVLIATRITDRVGRKPLLLGGLVGMVPALTVLGLSSLLLADGSRTLAYVTIGCIMLYTVSFSATWGPTLWVVLSEIFPLKIRGAAMGIAVILHWAANFLVSQTFPLLLATVGAGVSFLGYAVIGMLVFIFVYFKVVETKGRSLEKIESDLRGRETVQRETVGQSP